MGCVSGMIRRMLARVLFLVLLLISAAPARADDPIVIHGPEQASLDPSLHSGGLEPARGVANIQVFRASRAAPDLTDGKGWTYHHHVDLAAWRGRLYVAWNSTEKDEDVWPSRELYATSTDGFSWSPPSELFPMGVSTGSRMYFFCAPNGRMLAIAGLRTSNDQMTERKKGALVVREIFPDHSLGPVFTLRPPADPQQSKPPPGFQTATEEGFVQSCKQLLANKPFLEQADYGYLLGDARMKWHDLSAWPADEPSREYFDRFGKAISFFHRKDGSLVGVMKWGWVIVSPDEGQTWTAPVRPPTFVSGMAKAWGQRTGDGRYALVYDPHLQQRYPLVIVHADDGINFYDMRTVHADVPPLRYPGRFKSPGPQYVRGISEWSSDGSWRDASRALWVCYSVNKEDIWVSRVPLPLGGGGDGDATADVWNTYSPRWAPVAITMTGGTELLELQDRDPADYARATRFLAKPAASLDVSFDLRVNAGATVPLDIQLNAARATQAASLIIKPTDLVAGEWRTVRLHVDCPARKATAQFANHSVIALSSVDPAAAITGITFRTGERAGPASFEQDRATRSSQYQVKNLVVSAIGTAQSAEQK